MDYLAKWSGKSFEGITSGIKVLKAYILEGVSGMLQTGNFHCTDSADLDNLHILYCFPLFNTFEMQPSLLVAESKFI